MSENKNLKSLKSGEEGGQSSINTLPEELSIPPGNSNNKNLNLPKNPSGPRPGNKNSSNSKSGAGPKRDDVAVGNAVGAILQALGGLQSADRLAAMKAAGAVFNIHSSWAPNPAKIETTSQSSKPTGPRKDQKDTAKKGDLKNLRSQASAKEKDPRLAKDPQYQKLLEETRKVSAEIASLGGKPKAPTSLVERINDLKRRLDERASQVLVGETPTINKEPET